MVSRYSKTRSKSVTAGGIPSGWSVEYYKPRNSDGRVNVGLVVHNNRVVIGFDFAHFMKFKAVYPKFALDMPKSVRKDITGKITLDNFIAMDFVNEIEAYEISDDAAKRLIPDTLYKRIKAGFEPTVTISVR